MARKHPFLSIVAALALVGAATPAAAVDTGSAAFDRYVQDLQQRMHSADTGNAWVSTTVDGAAFERYMAVLGSGAGGPGLTDTATHLASLRVQPLRSFDGYLAYLGLRLRADAGPTGKLLESSRGTELFDQYIEDINHRIQALYLAGEAAER